MAVIAVAGEALIDLVVGSGGQVDAHPGGGPYNAARTLARLGVPTAFLGRLAADGFGRLLRDRLTAEGVVLGLPEPSPGPSTLAVATVDQAGVASYSFYLDGTAAADVSYQALRGALESTVLESAALDRAALDRAALDRAALDRAALDRAAVERAAVERAALERAAMERAAVERAAVERTAVERAAVERTAVERTAVERTALESTAGVTAVHVGTLGLLMEPVGAAIERLIVSDVPPGVLVFLDPNCRPGAVTDAAAYRARVGAIAARADIVKASVEDLAYLYPGMPPESAAKALLEAGPPLVLVTDGPRPARAFLAGSVLSAEAPSVAVADTIGAGDAFGGGFLAWWTEHGLDRADLYVPSDARAGDARAGDARAGDARAGYDRAGQGGAGRRREELVGQALRAAAAVAALTCARPGADPPALADVVAKGWWPDMSG